MKWLKNKDSMAMWMTLPALAAVIFLFFSGIVLALLQSFGWFPAAGASRLSVDAYAEVFRSPELLSGIWLSLRVSVISTAIAAVAGLLLALGCFSLRSHFARSERLLRAVFSLPLGAPHLVAAYAVFLLLSQSGWLSRVGHAAGLTDEMTSFPVLVNDAFGWGMIAAYVWKEVPFIFLCVYPVLERIRSEWHDAARIFGAGSFAFVRLVVLPLTAPALAGASFIVFAYAFSAFEIPYLLGVTYPEALPVYAYELYSGNLEKRPQAMVVGLCLAAIPLLVGALAFVLLRRFFARVWRGW